MSSTELEALVDEIYDEPYEYSDRTATETTRTTKGKAAAVMVVSGASFDEVAETLGFPSARVAELAVQRALADSLDSWDKADLKRLILSRYDALFRAAFARSNRRGYAAREAASRNAIRALDSEVAFLGLGAPTRHEVHSPVESEIAALVHRVSDRIMAAMPEEVDVLDAEVVHEIGP